ncbi:MAG: hypothetical protein O7G85_17300 [Planctomycetota bacterium]|nr:hypothetical protein [Planctomycetota bacterium]
MFNGRLQPMTHFSGLAGLLTLLLATSAPGQNAPPSEATPSPDASIQSDLPTEIGPLRPGGTQLLREGSLLVDVRGLMHYDESRKVWIFEISGKQDASSVHSLTLLPCFLLQEMIELHAIAEQARVAFEVSGRVLVYRGRSYLLPTSAPQIFEQSSVVVSEPETIDDQEVRTDVIEDEDSIENIMSDLDEAIGPIARTIGSGSALHSMDDSVLVLEGTMIVSRRGHLTRTATGAWLFVFDSDASGLGDPPMIILPCLLLERMERHTRTRGGVASMNLSGRVLAFRGQNYLYPTVFQIPRERTSLTP